MKITRHIALAAVLGAAFAAAPAAADEALAKAKGCTNKVTDDEAAKLAAWILSL